MNDLQDKIDKKELRKLNKLKKLRALVEIAELHNKSADGCETLSKEAEQDADKDLPDKFIPIKKMKHDDEASTVSADHNDCKKSSDSVSVDSSNINDNEYKKLQYEAKKIRVRHKKKPSLVLKVAGDQALVSTRSDDRIPIMITDIQHLLLNSIMLDDCPHLPLRWCRLNGCKYISQTVVLIVDGLSLYDYITRETLLEITKKFEHQLEVVTPSLYGGSIIDELAVIPLSDIDQENLIKEHGSMAVAMEIRKDLMVMMRAVFPVNEGSKHDLASDINCDTFSRAQLVLSAWQLVEENYPLPLKGKLKSSYAGYVMTKDNYTSVSASSPMFGLDCEMCRTHAGFELTRISLVNENYETIYEKYVLPYNKIIDYMTSFSGITKATLEDVDTRLEDVQKDLKEILPPNAILVGQSLNFDLHALKMMHPYVIDTSVIFNTTGERGRKSKLKQLATQFLNVNIQQGNKGHCSIEDAITSLKLVKLKLTKHISFGDAILKGKSNMNKRNYDHLHTKTKKYTTNIFSEVIPRDKSFLIIGTDSITDSYSKYLKNVDIADVEGKIKTITIDNNESAIQTIIQSSKEYSLTFSHININTEQLEIDDTYITLNKHIEDIRSNIISNGLLMVIFSGNDKCNGIALIDVKK